MRSQDIAKEIARQTRSSAARSADKVDRVVNNLIRKLRKGQKAQLPGLGRIDAPARKDASA